MSTVLIVGAGGREHALGWKLAQSPHVTEVFYSPGNGGTAEGKGHNLSFDATRPDQWTTLLAWLHQKQVSLILIGPEVPLNHGLVDTLHKHGISNVFGPSQAATQLEADKFFSYQLMNRLGIPQAHSVCCHHREAAEQAIHDMTTDMGIVLKARGLAGGKGVVVCRHRQEALQALPVLIQAYGSDILVAERLFGPEFSVFAIVAGDQVLPLPVAFQDYKQLQDGDHGPNTGGMGAYGPVPFVSASLLHNINQTILSPVIQELKAMNRPYCGFLYAGMIMTIHGPKVLEFNVRFGDPECQSAMMLLESDLFVVLQQALQGQLRPESLTFRTGAACCVVLAAPGYPDTPRSGLHLSGLEQTHALAGVKVFHAGTTHQQGRLVSSGGRVLGITAYAETGLMQARDLAYQAISFIPEADQFQYRRDIARTD